MIIDNAYNIITFNGFDTFIFFTVLVNIISTIMCKKYIAKLILEIYVNIFIIFLFIFSVFNLVNNSNKHTELIKRKAD